MSTDFFERLSAFWGAGGLGKAVGDFVRANCAVFDRAADEEGRHEFFELYQRYCSIVESQLEGFLADEGIGSEEFYAMCKEVKDGTPERMFVNYLLGSLDYTAFHSLARDFRALASYDFGALDCLPLEDDDGALGGALEDEMIPLDDDGGLPADEPDGANGADPYAM